MECFEKLIKKDWLHPLTGDKLTEKDIIPLQRVWNYECEIYYIISNKFIRLILFFIRVVLDMQQPIQI